MDLGLTGKTAIVTGGSRGLGFAAAQALIAEGANLVVCARGAEALEQATAALQKAAVSGARAFKVVADVSTEAGVKAVVDTAVRECGGIDVLVNNVGLARGADIEATTDADWQEAFDQTLFPAIRMTRLAVPHLRKRGGAIVIVSSIFGRESGGRMTYNAVKAAEISLTKSLAQQLA
jgi:3-oxoacyl-[acyl-carrier protein] reductase